MIVVDSSAVVAALSREPDGPRVNRALARAVTPLMSAATYLESSIVLGSRFGDEADVEIVPVDRALADAAVEAWLRFGKGRHPAALNFGDCFAYALASLRGAPLLFIGDDFARTDIGTVL